MKPKKYILICLPFIFLSVVLNGQVMEYRDRLKIIDQRDAFERYTVPIFTYTYDDPLINAKLLEAAQYQRKENNRLLWSVILVGAGTTLLVAGLTQKKTVDPNPNNNWFPVGLSESFLKTIAISHGLTLYAISIPVMISAGKNHQKKRDSMEEARKYLMN